MTFDEIMRARRSIRRYQDRPVDADTLSAVVEAGRLAPSARNRQDWKFIVVTKAALREKMADACNGQGFVGTAPAILVAASPADRPMSCGQSATTVDCSIALTCMMLKATELGLGSCWLGAFSQDAVKRVLGLPATDVVVAVMPLGYPDEAPAPRPRKGLAEVMEIR